MLKRFRFVQAVLLPSFLVVTAMASSLSLAAGQEDFPILKSEVIGGLSYNMPAKSVAKLIVVKPIKGAVRLDGADDAYHQDWKYPKQGLIIGMMNIQKHAPQTLDTITVVAPSTFETRRHIHIGSPEADILKAYKADISQEESKQGETWVIGSVYGGLVFEIKKGMVSKIFLGAAAE
jgi:hypothetical protein